MMKPLADIASRNVPDFDCRTLPVAVIEEMVARFDAKIFEAQITSPPSYKLISDAVRRKNAERCPVWLRRITPDLIVRYGDALIDLFCEFPDDLGRIAPYDMMVGYNASPRISVLEALTKDAEWTSEWGVKWQHVIGGVGATEIGSPLTDWERFNDYAFPDPCDPARMASAFAPAKALRDSGKYSFGLFGPAFYNVFSLRGMENALMDLCANEREIRQLIDKLQDYALQLIQCWAKTGVNALLFLDDWGTQNGLMISPKMWREFFKPGYKVLFDEVHRLGMDAFLHSCGNVMDIVEDLIEIGLDVLDPIQTSAMNISELAKRFGGRISFCGTIDVQHLLPYASPREVKDTIRRTIDVLGASFGNGLILAPTNTITPDVTFENLRAMFEVCHGV